MTEPGAPPQDSPNPKYASAESANHFCRDFLSIVSAINFDVQYIRD